MTGGRSRGRAPRPGRAWGGRGTQRLVALVLAEYGDACHLCGRRGATTADHVLPRHHGGTDDVDNLRPAHLSCNSARGAMPLDEWFARHPIDSTSLVAPSREW